MAYDTTLENRIDEAIAGWKLEVGKKKMFGGVGYFINRNMAFGIKKDELIVKAAEATGDELLRRPGVGYFVMGDRPPMKSWYLAGGEAIADDAKLAELLEISRDYTLTLPPK